MHDFEAFQFVTQERRGKKKIDTFKRCKLVVGGSAIALKILVDDGWEDANFCSTGNLFIHGFDSKRKKITNNHQGMISNTQCFTTRRREMIQTGKECTRSNKIKPGKQIWR